MFSLYLVKSATISILSVFGSNRMASKNWRYSPLYFYFCLNMIFVKLFVFKIEFINIIDSYIIDQNFSHLPHCFLGTKKNLDALYPSFSFFLCLALNLKKIKVKFRFFFCKYSHSRWVRLWFWECNNEQVLNSAKGAEVDAQKCCNK